MAIIILRQWEHRKYKKYWRILSYLKSIKPELVTWRRLYKNVASIELQHQMGIK